MSRTAAGRLANTLKQARLSAGVSLRDVERATHISNAYLSQLENGRTRNPSPHVLAKLARAYDVLYDDLMSAAGYPDGAGDVVTGRTIAALASGLNDDEQRQVAEFIHYLRDKRGRAPHIKQEKV